MPRQSGSSTREFGDVRAGRDVIMGDQVNQADLGRVEALLAEIRTLGQGNPLTQLIDVFLFHPSLPVDVRHNAKIFREKLALWAAKRLSSRT